MELRVIKVFLAILLLGAAGCATHPGARDGQELLSDASFSRWMAIKGLGAPWDDGGRRGVFRTSPEMVGDPVWSLAQWASTHDLADPAITRQTQPAPHIFEIANPSKRIVVDSRAGELELELTASACYSAPRRKGDSWPHLLAECSFTDKRNPQASCRLISMKRLDVSLESRLVKFEDHHPAADPNLHAAQFQLFLYVQNLNTASPGYGDMLWFGIPIFDNRNPSSSERYKRDDGKSDASGKFIYAMPADACQPHGAAFFRQGEVHIARSGWTLVRANVLPWLRRAIELAHNSGYLASSTLPDLYVSAMNIGWEMPGTYDASMRLRRLSIQSEIE